MKRCRKMKRFVMGCMQTYVWYQIKYHIGLDKEGKEKETAETLYK